MYTMSKLLNMSSKKRRVITGSVKKYVTIIRTHMKYLNNTHKINQILAVTKRVTALDFILKEMINS